MLQELWKSWTLMKLFYSLITLILTLMVCSCTDNKGVVIARVEGTILTDSLMFQEIGKEATSEQQREYVRRWLDRELLYQAAKKEKMHRDSVFRKKIKETEQNLLSMAYLNQLVKNEPEEVTEKEVETFFNAHRDQYKRKEDIIRYAVFSLNRVTDAWNIRKNLTKKNFFSSSRRYSTGKTVKEENIKFVKRSSLSPKLQELLFSIKEGGITKPVRVGNDVNLYLIIEKGNKGENATLEEVYQEVRNYLVTARYQEQIDSAINNLRDSSNYTFNHTYFEQIEDSQVSLRGNENE